jgi:enterobactin synthetase component D
MSIVRNPAILPSPSRQFSIRFEAKEVVSDVTAFHDIVVPPELQNAVAPRQWQFRAGRFCAFEALRLLEPHRVIPSIPRSESGAPVWPDGITGSITHTEGFVSAAVARTSDLRAVGIDSEPIMSAERADRVSSVIASPCELAHVTRAGYSWLEAMTLVFSAKEAIFKCLRVRVPRFIDFHDLEIIDCDPRGLTFTARVMKTLSERLPVNAVLRGQFEVDARWIHTGVVLEAKG